jgi:hypothetical protein
VSEQLLHRADIDAALDQVCRKTVAERVAVQGMAQAAGAPRLRHGALQGRRIHVVSALAARPRTVRQLPRGKHELPAEFLGRARILPLQGVREFDAGHAAGQVALVELAAPVQLPLQVGAHRPGQHDHAVLVPLAGADHDLPARQVRVLDAHLAALQQAQAAAVQQPGHELKDAVAPLHALEDGRHLLRRQHHGQPLRTPCPHRVEAAEVDLQHLLVQEHQGIEGLVLRAGRDLPVHGQVGEELLHLGGAHRARMPLVVEVDEARDPLDVALLRAPRIVANAQHLVDLVEQAGRSGPGQFTEVEVQDLAVQKVEGVPAGGEGPDRVVLGLGDGLQELAHLGQAHLPRVAFAVEEDEAEAPVGEDSHGRLGVTALPGGPAQLVEQPRRSGRWRGRRGRWLGSGAGSHGGPPGRSSEREFS